MNRLLSALRIYYVRIMPIVFMIICLLYYVDLYYSIIDGSYYEVLDKNGELIAIQYDFLRFSKFWRYFSFSIPILIPFLWLSKLMRFCFYHRLSINYLIANSILVNFFNNRLTTDNTMMFVSIGMILWAISIVGIIYCYINKDKSKR